MRSQTFEIQGRQLEVRATPNDPLKRWDVAIFEDGRSTMPMPFSVDYHVIGWGDHVGADMVADLMDTVRTFALEGRMPSPAVASPPAKLSHPVRHATLQIEADDNVRVGAHSLVPGEYRLTVVFHDAPAIGLRAVNGFLTLKDRQLAGDLIALSAYDIASLARTPGVRVEPRDWEMVETPLS